MGRHVPDRLRSAGEQDVSVHGQRNDATLKGIVSFTGSSDCAQTWIVKGVVYCGDAGNNNGEVFNYPAGGSPIAVFTGIFDFPLGVTVTKK